ncbi:unnamed protein product [Ectocarpus sp. CCAP 1310/34]|nr:unnamed protein product [Ectocarpus sp. CCAP 1310/34]
MCPEQASALAQLDRDGGERPEKLSSLAFEVRDMTHVGVEQAAEESPRSFFGVEPFLTPCGPNKVLGSESAELDFSVKAPTTSKNLRRVLRALQIRKAVLLEGSPGVGKTSLISALAAAAGHELVRINLSEQTDVSDLFGSDLPVPGTDSGELSGQQTEGSGATSARFTWCDGVFLSALKAGKWVLLDELNLAPQSVLEGLNACLDHRAEVYIPELGRSFRCPPTFKVFAAQNPLGQGGGRKGLPRSFLSRFTKVEAQFPLGLVQYDTMEAGRYGQRGSPWEFNLREVFRWCELMLEEQQHSGIESSAARGWKPWLLVDTLYIQRLRTRSDRAAVLDRFRETFPEAFVDSFPSSPVGTKSCSREGLVSRGCEAGIGTHPVLSVTPEWMQVGQTVLPRGCWGNGNGDADGLRPGITMPLSLRRPLQALARCVAMGWPALVVGHRGSGKSGIIKGLAAGVGARLTEVAMTPSVDVTELLGCFEQTDARAVEESLVETLEELADKTCRVLLEFSGDILPEAALTAGALWDALHAVRRTYCNAMAPDVDAGRHANILGFTDQGMVAVDHLLSSLKSAMECIRAHPSLTDLKTARGKEVLSLNRRVERAAALATNLQHTVTDAALLANAESSVGGSGDGAPGRRSSRASCFCWSDGVLVQALERGDWIVLDGANLCSASVLDRLNPLLEPGGVLPLTECGTSSGASPTGHRTIRPHSNFRLFLTADPSCGEVSRAMRNRCVEVSLLDAPPAVTIFSPQPATANVGAGAGENSSPATAVTEHAADLLSMVCAAGLTDPREATAAVAVHSAFVARSRRGGNAHAGNGPAPRALLRWAELVAACRSRRVICEGADDGGDLWLRCLPLAYPTSSPGGISSAAVKLARNILSTFTARPLASGSEESISTADVISSVVPCGWREIVEESVVRQVIQDVKLLEIVVAASSTAVSAGGDCCLLPLVVDAVGGGQSSSTAAVVSPPFTDLRLEPGDAALLLTAREAAFTSRVSRTLLAQAAVLVARKASSADLHLRVMSSGRVTGSASRGSPGFGRGRLASNLGEAVAAMMAVLFDSPARREVSAMLAEMESEANVGGGGSGAQDNKTASLRRTTALVGSRWSTADPRENHLFGSLQRMFHGSRTWEPCMILLGMVDLSLFRRLPVVLAERAELLEAQRLLSSGRGEASLGWLGLSWLICEGSRDAVVVGGGGRGGAGSTESRLARSSLGPYLWPLLRSIDMLVQRLACREVADLAAARQGCQEFPDRLLGGVRSVMEARDTLSGLLVAASASSDEGAWSHRASAGGSQGELLFAWDPFLVTWRWLQKAFEALRATLGAFPTLISRANVSSAFATVDAVGSRVDAAVLQYAGGAAPTRDTLWKHGPRAAAPSSAAGAIALARLGRLADEYRILPSTFPVSTDSGLLSLGRLMREAHPSLCVSRDTRAELLHALCTLHWVCSNEQDQDGSSFSSHPADFDGGSVSLAARLPGLLEDTLKSSRARFEAAHKGTRLGGAGRRNDGLEHHQDDLEYGERFDEFDTEATEAVANATLLVVAGDSGSAGGDGIDDGVPYNGEGVMQNWALVQLSPLMEHWIAVEECEILAVLAGLDAAAALGCREKVVGDSLEPHLMARLSRLRSAMLVTPSLSPAVARPHQTLLWAWGDSSSWPNVVTPLLKRLLPVAMASFGRRLWENVVGAPEALSLQLAPPEIVDGGGEIHKECTPKGSPDTSFAGPVQLLTLARSSFLLRLSSTAIFCGDVAPGGKRNAVDLTLMNASARLRQYRVAMRRVRDLAYGGNGGGGDPNGALKPLVKLAWASFCRTLGAFDEVQAREVDEPATFANALFPAGGDGSVSSSPSWGTVKEPLLRALRSCPDQRLAAQTDSLVLPAARHLLVASEGLVGQKAEGPTARVEASAGLGMALLGCLKLVLLPPSSPVDPGLKPALKRELLGERLDGYRGELTVRRWSLRLEGGGDVSPEMLPLLQQARNLRDDCTRLGLEAIERPDDRPSFHSLFRDVQSFARGLADPDRVTALAQSLARFVDGAGGLEDDLGGGRARAVDRAALLQEETVWQDAAGAFVGRFRSEYGEAYADVVTGICDAVEVTRLGLRLLAAACSSAALFSPTDATPPEKMLPRPLAKLQGMLLSFPYPCCEGLTRAGDGSGDGVGEALRWTLGPSGQDSLGANDGGGFSGWASGPQHMMLLQAVLSRAELLLSAECSAQPALDAAVTAMEGAVDAWSRVEAEELEKRRKEAEILKFKMQEHVVESEEAIRLAKLRALFPDYQSGFEDIIAENTPTDSVDQDEAGDNSGTGDGVLDARVKALGHMSDKHLSSLVARHCRIFLSLSARRRRSLRGIYASREGTSPETNGVGSGRSCSDAETLVAFRDSYRSSVLFAASSSKLSSSVVLSSPTVPDAACTVLHMEEAFAASHLLALADAARLCKTGRSLLEDAAAGGKPPAFKKASKDRVEGVCGVDGWLGDGAVRRNLLLVDPLVNFHLDGNVAETRLADGPLASVLRRVAGLLEDFPGHGVLIQLARVADRVRRMPLHSPLAAVLAGVELTLRKAQDWEQHAHRGVSLRDELRSLSSLVARWRAIELKSWPHLLDAREGAFVLKANRWWLHLYRLLTGHWKEDSQASNPLQLQCGPAAAPGGLRVSDEPSTAHRVSSEKVVSAPDWPSARGFFPDWLWSGLVSNKGVGVTEESSGGIDAASLDHARGLFQPLDDFLRTSSIGEFFARLQMLRAFAAQLGSSSNGGTIGSCDDYETCTTRAQALGIVVQGLWQYYSQFSEEVENARALVRKSIEKKLKEEAKLAKWDEQTYYSLAESSEKSHRKLFQLVSQYDEVLEVSVSEVLHRTLISGIGERQEGNYPNPMAPCTEIPTLGSMFSVVKKVDTAVDFLDDDDEKDRSDVDHSGKQRPECGVDEKPHPAAVKPSKPKRLTFKTTPAAGKSLELLDACLPGPPPNRTASMPGLAAGDTGETPLWLTEALFSTSSVRADAAAETGVMSGTSAAGPPVVARLAPLAHRMRSLLMRSVYARGRIGSGGGWADGGRPAGFVGAGLAEELCLAVFSRIQGLRAKGVGKQVKKRAVLDLLGGLRKQGLSHAKSNTPPQTSDMLRVMALAQPFCEDGLAGFDIAWLFSGDGGTRKAKVNGTDDVAADLLRRSERYYLRGVSELSRLRLEAGAPVSSDITRREAEVMRGLAENLGLLVLQQRGVATALESDLLSFVQEVRAMQSLTTDYGVSAASSAEASSQNTSREPSAIPPQSTLRLALETQRRGLLRGLEAVREVQLLLTSMAGSDPPVASASSPESRLRRARGGEGWGEAATDATTYAEVKAAVDSLQRSLSGMLCAVQRYPPPTTIHGATLEVGEDGTQTATPLLAARAARLVLENQEALRACSADSRELSNRFAGVLPRAMLVRVATHLSDVGVSVGSVLDGNSAMRSWLVADGISCGDGVGGRKETGGSGNSRQSAAKHTSEVGGRLTAAVKAMLLSVQSLCPRADKGPADGTDAPSPVAAKDGGTAGGQNEEGEDAWFTGTTLFEAHASAFEQARGLKLWRCASAMASTRLALKEFADDEAVRGASAGEAAEALVGLCREVLVLAEQVLSAGKAVLIGMVALNKGTAKLHYVTVRVFRTLLSKGLCSDESEGEGEGDGDIDGMKFDDDVEGTGMGEGEGKKDVTDQIEDEEQLLGLKGDEEPDKVQDQEAKELGEDDQDNGMEMENDFEGDMFDVSKGDEKDEDDEAPFFIFFRPKSLMPQKPENAPSWRGNIPMWMIADEFNPLLSHVKEDDGDEKEELDREMGDLGDNADVVDEKLWDEEDEDEDQEEGKNQGEEKFESGSRLDGEKPEEDEIRTKEDGQDDGDKGDGNEDDKGKDMEDKEGKDGDGGDGQDGKEGEDGDEGEGEAEGEGPVNDDLEDNYEDKPMGVEVRGEDEAMEVDEEGRDVEGENEKDGQGDEEGENDIPDDLNLDNAQEDGGDEEGDEGEGEGGADGKEGGEDDEDEEGKEKEGFESLAPEKEGEEKEEDLMEGEQQPQACTAFSHYCGYTKRYLERTVGQLERGLGNPGPADVGPMEEEKREDEMKDEEGGDEENNAAMEETRRAEVAKEPPAFGVEGEGGDSSVLEAAKDEGEGKPTEDEQGEDEEKEEGQDGGGSAPNGRDDGGGGGQGEDGEGGEWRPDMASGEGKGEGQGNDKRRRPDAPNPFRDPGDAMRHWHRRLDMLQDKDKEEAAPEGGGEKDLGDDDGGEGKFEYVTSTERGSSQVLGGVSEEQAAEAAHEQSKAQDDGGDGDEDKDKENVVEDGDVGDADAHDGVDAMDQDHEQDVRRVLNVGGTISVHLFSFFDTCEGGSIVPRADGDEEGLHKDGSEVVDSSRKSGKRRDKDGHREEVEDGTDPQQEDGNEEEDETPVLDTENASYDLKFLEEPPPGAGDSANGAIVTNPLAARGDQKEGGRQSPRDRETSLREELHALAEELQRVKRHRDGEEGGEVSQKLWGRLRSVTGALSQRLCEQLRLVLEPMVATKLQGDYRSGKRINMRRVIPYIASGFRKDKIWLRRTKPAKRDYQILMAIDDSESMADCGAGALALAAMTTVASGLTQLEAGQLAVARFGEDLDLLHGFGDPFTEEAGAKLVDGFTFDQKCTNTAHTLEGLVSLLEEARNGFSMSSGGVGSKGTPRQLVLLLSDGRFDRENKDRLRKLVREMNERGQLLVLIVLDKEGDTSILKTREATYVNGKLVLSSYLDKYPFPLYILLNHIEALPETLADALRQWFELLQRQTAR